MPLPLLIPILVGLGGLTGAGLGIQAAIDQHDAGELNDAAKSIVRDADSKLADARNLLNDNLQLYGQQKLNVVGRNLEQFVETFGQLKNVQPSQSMGLGLPKVSEFTEKEIVEMREVCNLAEDIMVGMASGAGGGTLMAFGAYNGTMLLASAGTGTAISSLSGVAATNATLAWLGGGTIASGGLGVAGGTMVLGTLVAGPALLIFGGILGANASAALADAKSKHEESKKYRDELDVVSEKLVQTQTVVNLSRQVLRKFAGRLRRANKNLTKLIGEFGVNYSLYTEEQKQKVFITIKYAQLVKALIDLPLLTEEGNLMPGVEKKLVDFQGQLDVSQ